MYIIREDLTQSQEQIKVSKNNINEKYISNKKIKSQKYPR